jgi:hypothetical protein
MITVAPHSMTRTIIIHRLVTHELRWHSITGVLFLLHHTSVRVTPLPITLQLLLLLRCLAATTLHVALVHTYSYKRVPLILHQPMSLVHHSHTRIWNLYRIHSTQLHITHLLLLLGLLLGVLVCIEWLILVTDRWLWHLLLSVELQLLLLLLLLLLLVWELLSESCWCRVVVLTTLSLSVGLVVSLILTLT